MPTAWEGFRSVLSQLLAPLVDRCIRDAQITGHLCDRLPTGLGEPHRFALKLLCICLLSFCHDLVLLKEYILSFLSSTNVGQDQIPSDNHSPLHLTLVRAPPRAGVFTPANMCSRLRPGTSFAASCTASYTRLLRRETPSASMARETAP